jgi:hypothetical protein
VSEEKDGDRPPWPDRPDPGRPETKNFVTYDNSSSLGYRRDSRSSRLGCLILAIMLVVVGIDLYAAISGSIDWWLAVVVAAAAFVVVSILTALVAAFRG